VSTQLGEVLTAAITPFREDDSIDFEGFAELCRRQLEEGADGVVVAGSTGEGLALSFAERVELFRAAREACGGARVIAATGTAATAETVRLTEAAAAAGADAALVVVPYYCRPPTAGLIAHFRAVAEDGGLPVVLYNIPQRTARPLDSGDLAALAEIPGIVAVKQSDADLELSRFVAEQTPLELYVGLDEQLLALIELGASGGIFVFTHLVARAVKEIFTLARAGRGEEASALWDRIEPALQAVESAPNPIALKAALAGIGRSNGRVRLPLVAATPAEREEISAQMERAADVVGVTELPR
jgi:4-hydroxy-tetrahydrodipicolinate synthase